MRKFILTALTAALLSATLASCGPPPEPTVFGIRESVWKTLTPQEKKEVIKGYNQRKKINAQNAPLNNVINATNAAVQQEQFRKNWKENIPSPPPMPNFPQQ